MTPFDTILVANRGEIALRILRTARALGLRTVAVHSAADATAPHVRLADRAVAIGPAPAAESYLDGARIIAAAQAAGAQAVHPGYGFLAENADFARACAEAGLTFIGPGPEAIALMGNKAEAKRRMVAAGVPCVPGYEGADQSDAALAAAAREIGFPVMVKAAAGGGGRGMRLVERDADLAEALAAARSEARNAFGSDELILEKAIRRPRHVEVQVFADGHGTTIHMGERDCSVQRRHQKVVEEAPCPVMTPDLRARIGAAAVEAARAIGYRGAGTVEFLLDADGAFHFLEMNTRLQVEHPVTEMVTGLDLVALQIRVAQGLPLGLDQDDVTLNGHAMEVRLYAEDPAQGFLPATGPVGLWRPAAGDGIRIDAGIETGQAVTPFYDPMVAKVVAWGETRETARRRLLGALAETALFGLATNKGFLARVLDRPAFAAGAATTAFIDEEFAPGDLAGDAPTPAEAAMAAVVQFRLDRDRAFGQSRNVDPRLLDWSSGEPLVTHIAYGGEDGSLDLTVSPRGGDTYAVGLDDGEMTVRVLDLGAVDGRLEVDGVRHRLTFWESAPGIVEIAFGGNRRVFRNRLAFADPAAEAGGGGQVAAPMHGALLEVAVAEGDRVAAGDRLAVLEAMKMQHVIRAGIDGTVASVRAAAGAQVAAGDLLMEIVADE
ncbi:MAG: acetyl-CoA carboxylase biotin carboxylase subunit [Hyphomicrobiales bacterium]|nr:acetyl-CoA carboxylase biotin carboxylase subunit [Hyphomicrobiales bacterium]MCP5371304.1 acetyl-CoA carboxylase biotin carboxylase subunit [Hyphomicrobiales bacterium]